MLGTSEPIDGEAAPRPPLFPNAKLITQRREWDTFASVHPMQWAWYVADGIKDVPTEQRRPRRRRRRARQGLRAGLDPGPHGRQPLALRQHPRRGLGLIGERGRRRFLAPASLEDSGRTPDRGVLRPRGDPELEHARGLDRPVRLDDQGEGARRPEPARPALPQRLPLVGDAELEAPVAGGPDLLLWRDQLRRARRRRRADPDSVPSAR